MRDLVHGALFCIVLAQAGTACVIDSSSSSGGGTDGMSRDGNALQVTWNLVGGESNATAACPAITIVQVAAEPLGDGDDTLGDGDEIYRSFDCASAAGTFGDLAPDIYLVWVEILDETNGLVAQSGSQEVDVRAGDSIALEYTISVDHGSFGLRWTLTDGTAPLTCAEAGAASIWVISTHEGTGEQFYDSLDCADGEGETRGLPLGSYQVEISLLDQKNLAIGQPVARQAVLAFGNDYRDLGDLELVLGE